MGTLSNTEKLIDALARSLTQDMREVVLGGSVNVPVLDRITYARNTLKKMERSLTDVIDAARTRVPMR